MLYKYIEDGGFMMWPLMACSIVLAAVVMERIWVIGVKRPMLGKRLSEDKIFWHRRSLPFFMDVPPSLGLLGTVIGVVQSFELTNGRLDGEKVGAGLSVACLTTIFGLGIAIVASVSMYAFNSWAGGEPEAEKVPANAKPAK